MAEIEIPLDEILREHQHFLWGELQKMIRKKKIKGNQLLGGSIKNQVEASNENLTGKHELSFLTDGRFVDMGKGRLRKIESADTNAALITGKKRYPKKWYSRTAYGIIYGRLLPKLVVSLQENTLEGIKDVLQRREESYQK